MRIAHVSDCYQPRIGGIETQVAGLARAQSAAGHAVRVITATPDPHASTAGGDTARGVIVHRVAVRLPFDLPVHPRGRARIARLLERDPVDVVHVHAGIVSPFAWAGIRAARRLGLPTLVTVHSVWGAWARRSFAMSDALVAWSEGRTTWSGVSHLVANRVEAAMPAAGPVLVIPNGIDPAEWTVHAGAPTDGELRVLTVMRLAPPKRVIPLLRIVDSARRALGGRPRLRLTIVGDGPERGRAERFISRHGLTDTVRLVGRQSAAAIRELFAATDVYMQPSIAEAFGLAALEARTAGLPVLARSQSGCREFIRPGIEGLLADDDDEMARLLVKVAREPDVRQRIAQHNRVEPPPFTWPEVVATTCAVYQTAMRRSG